LKGLLKFTNVTMKRGFSTLATGLNIEIGPGGALHVAGPNGSGKSSLLRLAAGLLRPEAGIVERSRLALADDHLALDRELPLKDALSFWGGDSGLAMDAIGIGHLAQVPVRLLSSGQAKRATLARVAAAAAPLWLLDEPLNALDPDGVDRLSSMIVEHLASGGTVVAASHQPLPGEWRRLELGR
jgi:heme exporter protein A